VAGAGEGFRAYASGVGEPGPGVIPRIAGSADELLAGASERVVVDPGDGKSGSAFERVVIDDDRYFAKRLSYRSDWLMRVTGDHDHRPFLAWQAGLMDDAPPEIDHTVVGMALDGDGDEAVLTVLMRDVGEWLVPEGDDPVGEHEHLALLDGLAALSARFWGWTDTVGLTPVEARLRMFAPDTIAAELTGPEDDIPGPLRVARDGWALLPALAPELAEVLFAIHADPSRLAEAMRRTPSTFLHGDWKMGNLGVHPDRRTILIDWAYPGAGPVCWDLAWYLALNRARLPMSKEDTIDELRAALERRGVDTAGWFETQLELCLLGMTAAFGWEKAVGDHDELAWWERRAMAAARRLQDEVAGG
jgi:hypothetical protein